MKWLKYDKFPHKMLCSYKYDFALPNVEKVGKTESNTDFYHWKLLFYTFCSIECLHVLEQLVYFLSILEVFEIQKNML